MSHSLPGPTCHDSDQWPAPCVILAASSVLLPPHTVTQPRSLDTRHQPGMVITPPTVKWSLVTHSQKHRAQRAGPRAAESTPIIKKCKKVQRWSASIKILFRISWTFNLNFKRGEEKGKVHQITTLIVVYFHMWVKLLWIWCRRNTCTWHLHCVHNIQTATSDQYPGAAHGILWHWPGVQALPHH